MSEQLPAVEKMIAKVMKRKEFTRAQAIAYMLLVATGRLSALWRYDDSLPEGKTSKGVILPGKRKRAERSKPISFADHAAKAVLARTPKNPRKPKQLPIPAVAE